MDKMVKLKLKLPHEAVDKLYQVAKEHRTDLSGAVTIVLSDTLKQGVRVVTNEDMLKEYVGHDTGRE